MGLLTCDLIDDALKSFEVLKLRRSGEFGKGCGLDGKKRKLSIVRHTNSSSAFPQTIKLCWMNQDNDIQNLLLKLTRHYEVKKPVNLYCLILVQDLSS